jgi:hypothetical protein
MRGVATHETTGGTHDALGRPPNVLPVDGRLLARLRADHHVLGQDHGPLPDTRGPRPRWGRP